MKGVCVFFGWCRFFVVFASVELCCHFLNLEFTGTTRWKVSHVLCNESLCWV